MVKVLIYADETYMTDVFPMPPEDDIPSLYLPVEVPDDLVAAHEAAWKAYVAVLRHIVATYGESPQNPNYHEEWQAFVARHAPAPQPEPESAWAEYFESDEIDRLLKEAE